jgi:TPR repeat protein
MSFNFQVTNQCEKVEDFFKASLYKDLHNVTPKTCGKFWIRTTGPFVGIVSSLLTIAKRIAIIFECIIKGLANIFGAACSAKCSLTRGLNQLSKELFKNIVYLPLSLLSLPIDLIAKTVFMIAKPEKYTMDKWLAHDPIQKYETERQEITDQFTREETHFNKCLEDYKKAPENIEALKNLAKCHEESIGKPKDLESARGYYKKAADLGDAEAAFKYASLCSEREEGFPINEKAASEYFKKLANMEKPNPTAMCKLGIAEKDKNAAMEWFVKAANTPTAAEGNPEAKFQLATLYVQRAEETPSIIINLYKEAVEQGYTKAMVYLVAYLWKNPDPKQAEIWLAMKSKVTWDDLKAAHDELYPSS